MELRKECMKDIPYSVLKEDKRGYEILMLRDQYDNTFAAIARECGASTQWVRQIYSRMKMKQIRLYIRHISITLGHETTQQVNKIFTAARECYQDMPYACAYLEKKYKDILDKYRAGEPGMPEQFVKNLPPFRRTLRPQAVSRIVELREKEGAAFLAIAKELRLTPEKAKHTYDWFYNRQVLAYVDALQRGAKSFEEKWAIWCRYFGGRQSAKKHYERMLEEKSKG